ncbi:Piwi-domain-containing protein [Venturia nashicola]|uniref:Piwi-domain-containing protein n=1 Tax=Venturia nashicola TaxID=86259 RepID=A0A4Z1NQV7_9PEZI|nr:Piwi-domain-containing protein [Venturia nashicola]
MNAEIRGNPPAVNATTFTDGNNVATSIVAYLNAAYHRRAGFPIQHGNLRAINLGTPTAPEWYCPEHLQIMPYQPWTGLVPSTHSADMINAACLVPGEVKAAIMERGREALGIISAVGNNAILTGSGLAIGDQMMRIPMRQIPAPVLNYRSGNTVAPHSNDGQWNLSHRIFATKCDLYRLHFVANTHAVHAFSLSATGSPLYAALTRYLGHTPPPPIIGRSTHTINVPPTSALLAPLLGAFPIPNKRQMVVWIHPNGDKAQYVNFRTLLDRELGYSSFCITHAKLLKNWGDLGGFAANNAMKINVRVGSMGVNHHVDLAPSLPTQSAPSNYKLLLQHTMIIGADVTHPGGDVKCIGVLRGPILLRQRSFRISISMLGYLLSKWRANNKDPKNNDLPRHILYFRDGVSDSQSGGVRYSSGLYETPSYPVLQRTSSSTKPGTCVDSGITNPVYFDFYLQSHKAIKGTARPAHYFVLHDDNNFTAEQLQDLVHKLCFTYARSSTSVSYAAPAYYADRLCGRVRNYFSGYLSNTRTPRTVLVPPEVTQADATYNDFMRDWNAPGRLLQTGLPAPNGRGNPWHTELDDTTFWI